jgi:hypothetical protein
LPNSASFRVLRAGTHHASVGVGRPSTTYEPRRAADSVIYQVVRDHYETFVAMPELSVPAGARSHLERVCCYALRPRLRTTGSA